MLTEQEKAENLRLARWAQEQLRTLDGVISYMVATPEDAWRTKTVRSKDGATNCFFGHLFNMGANDAEGSALWHVFEDRWSTTYVVYPINDGEHPSYPQETPKQRVLAYLGDLRDGNVMTTEESMEACFQAYLAEDAAETAASATAVAGAPA